MRRGCRKGKWPFQRHRSNPLQIKWHRGMGSSCSNASLRASQQKRSRSQPPLLVLIWSAADLFILSLEGRRFYAISQSTSHTDKENRPSRRERLFCVDIARQGTL